MDSNSFSKNRKSKNKSFIVNNSLLLQEYVRRNQEFYGSGIVVVNLLLLKTENLAELDVLNFVLDKTIEPTVHLPISYIPQNNFWFKMIDLKIRKKHKINLLVEDNSDKIYIVFIKDDAIEYFSIYTIKMKKVLNP